MDLTDPRWLHKWRTERYPKTVDGPVVGGCGCEEEPMSSLWCATLAEAFGDRFEEGLRLLDYGCGYGRFFNFLTGRLAEFTYYGLEVADSAIGHGHGCVAYARETYGADPRGHFGLIGSELEAKALDDADVVLLGSIFTHVDFPTFEALMGKFLPVVARGGAIVFSVLHAERYACIGPGKYGVAASYHETRYTRRQVADFFRELPVTLIEAEWFQSPVDRQTVYRTEPARAPVAAER